MKEAQAAHRTDLNSVGDHETGLFHLPLHLPFMQPVPIPMPSYLPSAAVQHGFPSFQHLDAAAVTSPSPEFV